MPTRGGGTPAKDAGMVFWLNLTTAEDIPSCSDRG